MTFPSSLVHWPCFWLRCPQCLSHPLLKGALKFSFLGSEPQDWANASPSSACQGCQESREVRRTHSSLPRASSGHNGCVLRENPRTSKAGTRTQVTFSHWESQNHSKAQPGFVQQGSFSPAATVWLPGGTALRSWDPKTLKAVPLRQNSEFSISKGLDSKQNTFLTN